MYFPDTVSSMFLLCIQCCLQSAVLNGELRRQMTKTLSLSCCVEVYQPWCLQSLAGVAAQFLKTSPHKSE